MLRLWQCEKNILRTFVMKSCRPLLLPSWSTWFLVSRRRTCIFNYILIYRITMSLVLLCAQSTIFSPSKVRRGRSPLARVKEVYRPSWDFRSIYWNRAADFDWFYDGFNQKVAQSQPWYRLGGESIKFIVVRDFLYKTLDKACRAGYN